MKTVIIAGPKGAVSAKIFNQFSDVEVDEENVVSTGSETLYEIPFSNSTAAGRYRIELFAATGGLLIDFVNIGEDEDSEYPTESISEQTSTLSSEDILSIITGVNGAVTQVTASTSETTSGSELLLVSGDTLTQRFNGLGNISETFADDIVFSIKTHSSKSDEHATLLVSQSSGLEFINKESATSSNGSISIDDSSSGDLTVSIDSSETLRIKSGSYYYSLKLLKSGNDRTPVRSGIVKVVDSGVEAIS